MRCKYCSQEMSHHRYSYYNRDANQCEIEIVECVNCQTEEPAELAELREAGEKMAKQLRDLRAYKKQEEDEGIFTVDTKCIFNAEDAAALKAWEAANK